LIKSYIDLKTNAPQSLKAMYIKALNFGLIFALLIAVINPACATMRGGQSDYWEICTASGDVERIAANTENLPFLPDEDPGEIPLKQSANQDCTLCMQGSQPILTTKDTVIHPAEQKILQIHLSTLVEHDYSAPLIYTKKARAPPIFS